MISTDRCIISWPLHYSLHYHNSLVMTITFCVLTSLFTVFLWLKFQVLNVWYVKASHVMLCLIWPWGLVGRERPCVHWEIWCWWSLWSSSKWLQWLCCDKACMQRLGAEGSLKESVADNGHVATVKNLLILKLPHSDLLDRGNDGNKIQWLKIGGGEAFWQ